MNGDTMDENVNPLEPPMTAEQVYVVANDVEPLESDFSGHGRCGHWRS
jgi:hypothetical protein